MAKSKVYYREKGIVMVYNPKNDIYTLSLKSTAGPETSLSLDQRIIEEFSRNDVNHLSSKLPLIGLDNRNLSRTDVERIHKAIVRTMEKFQQDFQKFSEKKGL